MTLTDDQEIIIGKEFIKKYLENGFGIMTKSNFEILLFHVMKEKGCFDGKTNFQISRELRISEERVTKLAYNAQLMYAEHGNDDEILKKILSEAVPKNEGKKIQFSIEDAYMRKLLRSKIREQNNFSDGSFLADVVTIDVDTYVSLVESLFYNDINEKEDIIKKCKQLDTIAARPDKDSITLQWILKTIIGEACKEIIKQGLGSVSGVIKGITTGKEVIKIITKFFSKIS